MDPTARRETWDIIKEARKDKIIILTTHYMDEAEMLADRVAIVSRGSLKTCGSTFFLKNRYGMGYYIDFDAQDTQTQEQKDDLEQIFRRFAQMSIDAADGDGDDFEILENELGNTVFRVPSNI
jgi:ABC-type multidrug transport system ATPase subunit